MARIIDAILAINPSAKVVTRGSDIDTIEIDWVDTAEISKTDIQTKLTELNNDETIIANRQSEYGSNTQQIENIIENGLVAEQARVQAIKDKYPKT